MISRYSSSRTLKDNILLGAFTGFIAGMVNVAAFMIFFSFASNVTGYYAVLAAEIVKGNLYEVAVVLSWILLFFLGSFTSNLIVIYLGHKRTYLAHVLPVLLEMLCLAAVGFYGSYVYEESLWETELLLAVLLFSMGLQNGFTASISNFTVKTTHLTGATTDMAILLSMFTKAQYRNNAELKGKAQQLIAVSSSYLSGAIVAGFVHQYLGFRLFFVVCLVLLVVVVYDSIKVRHLKQLVAETKKQELVNN